MGELLPKLQGDGIRPCVFYLDSDQGVVVEAEGLLADLEEACSPYD